MFEFLPVLASDSIKMMCSTSQKQLLSICKRHNVRPFRVPRVSAPLRSDIGLSCSLPSPKLRAWLVKGAQEVLVGRVDRQVDGVQKNRIESWPREVGHLANRATRE